MYIQINILCKIEFNSVNFDLSQGLNRCESMGSIGHRTLLQFLDAEDLNGLRAYLESRQSQVDDRDEVSQ